MKKKMKCVNNNDYEKCLTLGKVYNVHIHDVGSGNSMKKLKDDNGEFLQTMIDRFEEV